MFKPLFKLGLFFANIFLFVELTQAQPPTPKFESYQATNSTFSTLPLSHPIISQTNPLLPNGRDAAQNQKIQQQAGMLPGPVANERELDDEPVLRPKYLKATNLQGAFAKDFAQNFNEFLQLNPDHFSICRAVYLSESAYYDPSIRPTWQQFEGSLEAGARVIRQILTRNGLTDQNSVAVNYAIQRLFTQNNEFYDSVNHRLFTVPKLHYDFEDYMGDKDWTKMFVMKLLNTGTGQCHSMPLTYLCLAEQLHTKAYLSLAPNHSFVQYFDTRGQRYNFEATNGNLVTQTWLMQSTYINATALKNGTYLDTLSNRKLYAQCLSDFLLSYLMKTRRYDDFSDQIVGKILEVDPQNMTALMEIANRNYTIFQHALTACGNPRPEDYGKYPTLNAAYRQLQSSEQKIEATGYQEMPKEAYEQWLRSIELEKRREENQLEQERMNQEIQRLKRLRLTMLPEKKG